MKINTAVVDDFMRYEGPFRLGTVFDFVTDPSILTVDAAIAAGTTVTSATGFIKTGTYGESLAVRSVAYELDASTNAGVGTGTLTVSPGIPANSIVLGVTSFIDTILAGAGLTTWTLGVTGDINRYATPTIAIAAGTATTSLTQADTGYTVPHIQAAAIDILVTTDAGVISTGIMHICVHYITLTGPTT